MKKTKSIPSWIGDLMLFITALVWGGGFPGVKAALNTLSPFYIIGARFGIASLILVIIFWKHLRSVTKKDLKSGVIVGTLLFLGFCAQTTGASYIDASKLGFLTALNVLVVPFLGFFFFKEGIKKYNIIASLIATIGFVFLNNDAMGFKIGIGEVLGILSAIGFAAHIASTGYYSKKIDAINLAVIQMIVCCTLGFICAFIFEEPPHEFSFKMAFPVLYLGIFSTCIGFLFQTLGQQYTSASRAAIILCTESVFGVILSILLLGESITPINIVGAVFIMGGVVLSEYMHAKEEKKVPQGESARECESIS